MRVLLRLASFLEGITEIDVVKFQATEWQPMETAPRDGKLILVFAPGTSDKWDGDLGSLTTVCAWHPDAGFCVCELREPTHWMPLPDPPTIS